SFIFRSKKILDINTLETKDSFVPIADLQRPLMGRKKAWLKLATKERKPSFLRPIMKRLLAIY
ncbi:hypothetical protein ACFOEE_10185, partial [Pseudoalteromonas fenneropenaei]